MASHAPAVNSLDIHENSDHYFGKNCFEKQIEIIKIPNLLTISTRMARYGVARKVTPHINIILPFLASASASPIELFVHFPIITDVFLKDDANCL